MPVRSLPRRFRVLRPDSLQPLAAELGVVIVASLESGRLVCITTQRWSLMPVERSWASTESCTFPTIRFSSRSFISLRAIWDAARSIRNSGRIATLICWDQWYPEAARLAAMSGANVILSIPTAIEKHPAWRKELSMGAARRGARCSGRMLSPANGIYVAAADRVGFEGPTKANGSSSGRVFCERFRAVRYPGRSIA